MDVARGGASRKVKVPVDELCRLSPEFAAMWRDNDVYTRGEGTKSVRHPIVRLIALEYSACGRWPTRSRQTHALSRIKAKTFVIAIDEDGFFPLPDIAAEQKRVPGQRVETRVLILGSLGAVWVRPSIQ